VASRHRRRRAADAAIRAAQLTVAERSQIIRLGQLQSEGAVRTGVSDAYLNFAGVDPLRAAYELNPTSPVFFGYSPLPPILVPIVGIQSPLIRGARDDPRGMLRPPGFRTSHLEV
jgi:hypothetical protein